MPVERLEARGFLAGALGVFLARPPDRDELLHRIVRLHRFLHRRRLHRAPAVHDHVVGPVTAHVEPLRRLVLHFGGRDRIELGLEAELLRKIGEEGQRLLAIAGVEIEIADLLALELGEPAFLRGDVLDDHRHAVPIGVRRVEDPRERLAFRRCRQAIGHRQHGDLVDRRLRDDRQRDAGRPGIDDHRMLRLHRLVAFQALGRVVAGLAFLDGDLHAADAAVALVQHLEIIVHAVGDIRAGARERTRAIGEQRHENVLGRSGQRRRGERRRRDQGQNGLLQFPHFILPHSR